MNQVKYYFSTTEDGNLSYLVDDLKQNVDKNRQTVANIMEYKDEDLVYMNQVHGNNVQIVDINSPKLIENCDGLITKEKELPLMVMVADCI
ncbi:MAG: laccase domain-containing protein, partial [Campylobacterales bacterium]|nr:laccase domain-containing protein [Campylobacterales bacterium]